MNDLGNIDFSSNDPFKSRREFIKKKGGRPKTEWEDYIEEIEPLPFHPRSSQSERWTGTLRNADFISSWDMKHSGPRS